MKSLTSTEIALTTLFLKKDFDRTGESLSGTVAQSANQLLSLLAQKSLPKTEANLAADEPSDFGQTVLELEAAAKNDAALRQAIDALAAIVQAEPNVAQLVFAYARNLQQYQPATP